MKVIVREILITLGLALIISFVLQTTIASRIVDGSSMLPGLENGQRLIVVKAAYMFSEPQRGDIVVIYPPVAPNKEWVKRIIGIPGDTIEIKDSKVYLNGVALDEPYINAEPEYIYGPVTVPSNNYFVMGDNRNNSTDSHYGWTVSRDKIMGEVWLRIWPFSEWGIVHGYPITSEVQDTNQAQANPTP